MPAGKLKAKIGFYTKSEIATSYGVARGDWELEFMRFAEMIYLRGSEPVQAQRLKGIQPVVIKIRWSTDASVMDSSWLAKDERSGKEFQIRSVTPDDRKQYIEVLCESGVAV